MKRLLALLCTLLLLPACALGETSWQSYEEIVDFARARYGYTPDDSDYPFLNYDPLYIDPVAYFGYINHDHGVKDGELFIIQRGRSYERVKAYIKHLSRFGYSTIEWTSTDEQDNWTLLMNLQYAPVATVPPRIEVEYLHDTELLAVRYAHGYGVANRIWRARELTGDLRTNAVDFFGSEVRLLDARLTTGVNGASLPEDSPVYRMDQEQLDDLGITIVPEEGMVCLHKHNSHWADYDDAGVLLVQLSRDSGFFDIDSCFIVERAPDEGVQLIKPLFAGELIAESDEIPTLQYSEDARTLWLAFEPERIDPETPLRLYFSLTGLTGGKPIEYWEYIDLMPPQ